MAKFWLSAIIALVPATAIAQNLTDTHEQVSVPGKAIVAYRPIERNIPAAVKCHPDGTKAVACEAALQQARAEALASDRRIDTVRLGGR